MPWPRKDPELTLQYWPAGSRPRRPILSFKQSISWTSMALIVAFSSQPAQAAAITALPKDQSQGKIEQVFAFRDALPPGVSISEKGRIFVNFPRWGGNVPFTVGELREGKAVPYPDLALNQADLSERAIALRHRIQVAAGQWAEIQRLAIRREQYRQKQRQMACCFHRRCELSLFDLQLSADRAAALRGS